MILAGSDPRALWYATRGFGLADLVLLTLVVVLGVAQVARFARPGMPRFVISGLHRNGSFLAIALLAVHVITAVADPFAPIGVADAVVPFEGQYRPVWLGFGAVACDLLLALIITSLARVALGQRVWRAVHWCAYASWPVALVHALGTGSDSRLGWVQSVYAACALAVVGAVAWRLFNRWSAAPVRARVYASAATVVSMIIIGAWAGAGPLKSGWARKAGTPPALLHSTTTPAAGTHR